MRITHMCAATSSTSHSDKITAQILTRFLPKNSKCAVAVLEIENRNETMTNCSRSKMIVFDMKTMLENI